MARGLILLAALSLATALGAEKDGEGLRDLYFGEALYLANQEHYFEALERLDTELLQHYGLDQPELGSLSFHINDAEFSVGDFELNYRMHHRAGRAITAVLEGDVDETVRNEAAYRLARIHFQKEQLDDSMHALDRIEGRIPAEIRDDVEFHKGYGGMTIDETATALNLSTATVSRDWRMAQAWLLREMSE